MFISLLTVSSIFAVAAAFPASDGSSTVAPRAGNYIVQKEISGTCWYPPGSTSNCPTKSQLITGDVDNGERTGIILQNLDFSPRSFFVYKNSCECMPVKYITIGAGLKRFVAFDPGFQGRIVRGTTNANLDGKSHALGTWMEFSWDLDDGTGWADVSLIKGCDGAVDVEALDDLGAKTGFSDNVLDGAPQEAYKQKSSSKELVIMETESLTNATVINTAARDWLAGKLGYKKAYVDDHHGNPDICSTNGRFLIRFWPGRP
ncbi:hypothetical protein BKA67DRAFT_659209 [Truncatella angustata]|uniref:Uncharacterized protein n=1 Tax=Truncatella angustata TaxID=152316 RepID=A0A9P8ZVD3_9PEZI|nr:uncharacterized protein BKA67DRAFT_659209 [Truncatella angustata]KAH6652500.1 hypothetical protein BKA67DRAFT_659209 [Truncatella angustata]KAH8198989.1 hypothetical protein TruAng_006866 [Truncatella angustata]